MSYTVTMKAASYLVGARFWFPWTLAAFLLSIGIASAENDNEESDQLVAKIKQTIKQNEECKDNSACKQAAENNLILCPIGSTCVFMTNDFVPYNLAIPR